MNLENNKTLLIGLWNPQSKYLKTRHNIGADILEKFCIKNSIEVKLDKSGSYKVGQFSNKDSSIDIIFPMVSMNNSGEALKAYLKYSNVEASNILVIHDDIDLGFGRLRLKSGSSDGGHNGIKSIIYQLNTDVFDRLKIGIATDLNMRPSEVYVLKPFPKKYIDLVNEVIEYASDGINYYLNHDITSTMNNYNKRNNDNGK